MGNKVMSPSGHAKLARTVRRMRAEYIEIRASALAAGRAFRASPTGRNQLAREDAIGLAIGARYDLRSVERRLAEATIEPFGGRVSPAAQERLRARANG